MAGFELGSSSGMLAISDKFDTKEGESLLKESQDASKSLSKLNEATVGAFNEESKKEAIEVEGEKKEEEKSLLEEAKDAIADATNKVEEAVSPYVEAASDAAEKVADAASKAYDTLTDADKLQAYIEDKIPISQEGIVNKIGEIGDSLGIDIPCEAINDALNTLKDNFCATMPFPQCVSCSKRPVGNASATPSFLKTLSSAIDSLTKGIEGAATGLLGCPGLVQGIKGGILSGDFSSLGKTLTASAMTAGLNTAIDVGSSTVLNGICDMLPNNKLGFMGSIAAGMVTEVAADHLKDAADVMVKNKVYGDDIFKKRSSASRGGFQKDLSIIKGGGIKGLISGSTIATTKSGAYVSGASAPDAFLNSISKCYTSASTLSSSVTTRNLTCKGGHSACEMSNLPGTTLGISTIKNSYATYYRYHCGQGGVDYRRSKSARRSYINGVYRQQGTRVKVLRSKSLRLH